MRLFALGDWGEQEGQGSDHNGLALRLLEGDLTRPSHRVRIERLWDRRKPLLHPSLPPLIDLYWRGKRPGLVVPDLDQQEDSVPYPFDGPLEQRLRDALELAEVAVYLHQHRFLCGLFPAIKLWRRKGGILLNVIEGERPPREGRLEAAKVRYAAPEFLQGSEPDVLSDLYSLGLLLYHVLTGSPPFLEDDPDALRQKQMLAWPADPRQIEASLPTEALQMLAALTQKDRTLRPSSAEFAVTALRSACSSWGLPLPEAGQTPVLAAGLAGRQNERRYLEQRLDRYLEEGKPRVLLIRGGPGMGKSHLLQRLRLLARLRRMDCLSLSGAREGKPDIETWSALGETSKPQVVLCESAPPSEVIETLIARDEGPLLAFEARMADEPPLPRQQATLDVLDLGPLDDTASGILVRQALGRTLEPRPLERVLSQAGGNPLFLLETLRQWVRRGELRYRGGRWRLDLSASRSGLPPRTLRRTLRRQVEQLAPFPARLMQVLAVAEEPLPLSILCQVLESPSSRCEDALHRLQDLQLARQKGSLSIAWASLHHPWASQALIAALEEKSRRALHGSLAQAYRDRLCPHSSCDDRAAALKHSLRAGDARQANQLLWPAVEACEAESLLLRAAHLLEEAASSGLIQEPRWKLRLRMAKLLFRCGELERCVEIGQGLLKHPEMAQPARRAGLLALLARAGLLRGEGSRAIQRLKDALRCLDGAGPVDLDNEVRGELLAALAYRGRRDEARPLVRHLMREIEERSRHRAYDKVCHALFLYFYLLRGESGRGIAWEVRSIRLAFETGEEERALGRLLSLALVSAEQGRPGQAEAILRFVRPLPALRRHLEAGLFARLAECLLLRRRGRPRQALTRLIELKAHNRRANRSRNLGSALHIELARNFNVLLQPHKALANLSHSRRLLEREDKFEDLLDTLSEEARAWLILGRPERAERVLDRIECRLPSPRRTDFQLLRAAVTLRLGRSQESARLAASVLEEAALEHFPGDGRACCPRGLDDGFQESPWSERLDLLPASDRPQTSRAVPSSPSNSLRQSNRRLVDRCGMASPSAVIVEATMILARTCLSQEVVGRAYGLASRAWKSARALDDDPLQGESLLLLSQCALQAGRARFAILLARRGLQICDRLESPALRAGLLRHLGRALVRTGRTDQALRCFSQALQLLKEALFHLSTDERRAFSRLHLEPLEEERSQVLDRHDRTEEGRHLVQMRRWMSALESASEPRRWAELLLEAVCACIPAAGRVYLAPQAGSEPIPVASRGDCRHDGRALLRDPSSPALDTLRWRDQGLLSRLGIPLSHPSRGEGLLYLECPRQAVSETEIDYLLCLTSCLEMHWEREVAEPAPDPPGDRRTASARGAPEIIGRDPSMSGLMAQVKRIAPTSATVLISGESGTGKELVARALHHYSRRRSGSFVAVNCSGLPESLIESELFGHAKGAFTGASQDKRGLFEAASGGTLFLDEIASMPAGLQQSLLRALQEGRIRRVGETRERGVNVRVLSASNQPLPQLVSEGRFRSDLYHRLNVCHLQIPPLRRRAGDVALLAKHRLSQLCHEEGRSVRLSPEALRLLASYHFPGNVRELRNLIESAFYLAQTRTIQADDLRPRLEQRGPAQPFGRHRQVLQQLLAGKLDFWKAVRQPFLDRNLSRPDVRRIIGLGLARSQGSYRKLTALFNLADDDYKRFMSFLAHHDLKVDFRPYRRASAESGSSKEVVSNEGVAG